MRSFFKNVYFSLKKIFGIDLLIFINTCRSLPWFTRDYFEFKKKLSLSSDPVPVKFNIQLGDSKEGNGSLNNQYFQQDLLVAQYIFRAGSAKHVDIGSRVDGFVAHIASFREIEAIDIRPQNAVIDNIRFVQLDMMNIGEAYQNYCDSVSSLHAFEHFGLGRYGDPIDINGPITALGNVHRMLKDNGIFYFSTPIGPYRIEFNAHRVFSLEILINTIFKNKFLVEAFSYIDDKGVLHKNATLNKEDIANSFGCSFGCGIFSLRKIG